MTNKKKLWIPVCIGMIFLTWYLVSCKAMDNDGWWILATGRELYNGIPEYNPFTFVEGLKIVIQQWAWCKLCYSMFQKTGIYGVYVICLLLYLGTLISYSVLAKRRGIPINKAVTTGVVFLLFMFPFLSIRPTFFTVFLLMLQMLILEIYIKNGNWKYLLFLIPISLVEINFHSAVWVLHFVFLLPYLVPEIHNPLIDFKKRPFSRKPFLAIIPLMIGAGFINPYGMAGIAYLAKSYGDKLKDIGITELAVPGFDDMGILLFIVLVIYIVWISHKKTVVSSDFYLLCGTSILGVMHLRNLIYFLFGAMIFVLQMYNPEKPLKQHNRNRWTFSIVCLAATMIVCITGLGIVQNLAKGSYASDTASTPVKAVEWLSNNEDKDVKIFTTFNAGGYFEWSGFHCFIDARPELYFKEVNGKKDVFQDYSSLLKSRNPKEIREIIDEYDFEYICIDNTSGLNLYLQMEGCSDVLRSKEYTLYKVD